MPFTQFQIPPHLRKTKCCRKRILHIGFFLFIPFVKSGRKQAVIVVFTNFRFEILPNKKEMEILRINQLIVPDLERINISIHMNLIFPVFQVLRFRNYDFFCLTECFR